MESSVRESRPAEKVARPPDRAIGHLIEDEALPGGGSAPYCTIFLVGAECPFACTFCDLWQWTLDGPTTLGALPRQVEGVLDEIRAQRGAGGDVSPGPLRYKLYNASNFFEPRAVPSEDRLRLLELLAPGAGGGEASPEIVVESHARLLGEPCREFAEACRDRGSRLQVAMGVETVHPEALAAMEKEVDLDRLRRAGDFLRRHAIGLRCFLLVGVPGVPESEQVGWLQESIDFCLELGAEHVALIPTRSETGYLAALTEEGRFRRPRLSGLEVGLEGGLRRRGSTVISADLWDLEGFASCEACFEERRERLKAANLEQVWPGPLVCSSCETS